MMLLSSGAQICAPDDDLNPSFYTYAQLNPASAACARIADYMHDSTPTVAMHQLNLFFAV
jgi:hypothetical protein